MEQWTPATDGRRLRVHADPEAARAVPGLAGRRQQPRRGPAATAGDHAVSAAGWLSGVVAEADRRRRTSASGRRSIRSSRSRSGRTRRSRRSSWRPRTSPATSAAAARLQLRLHEHASRGRRRRRRCRWRSTRASCSSGCSASRAPRRSAWRSMQQRPQHPRLDHARTPTQLQRGLGAARSRAARRVSRQHPRDRAADSADRGAEQHARSTTLDAPVGMPESFEEHVGLMFDLLAVAYQADLTRVFTFMMARELSQRTYPQIGVSRAASRLSHHGNDPEKIAQGTRRSTRYHVRLFAKFLEKLQATPDGDGTLLDHSMIFYGGGMSNPNQHATDPLPMVDRRWDRAQAQPAPATPAGNAGRQSVAHRRQRLRQPAREIRREQRHGGSVLVGRDNVRTRVLGPAWWRIRRSVRPRSHENTQKGIFYRALLRVFVLSWP